MQNNNRRIVTFAIGGPLRGYYMDLEVRPDENDSAWTPDELIRWYCRDHFPLDWCTTYDPEEFKPQIGRFNLRLLAKGRIERFEGKNFFHEEVV